jgi:hypothetical protein
VSEAPITTQVGADLYDALEPLTYADEQLQWPLAYYLDALGLILEETAELVRADEAGNDGWSAFADPQRCPTAYLFTLAQWAGVRYPRRMDQQQLRDLIDGSAPGLWRGTRKAIEESIRRYLAPDGLIFFQERSLGNAYALTIFTFAHSTLNEAAIRRELLLQVPAGLLLTYEVRIGQDYGMLLGRLADYAAMKATWPTYQAVYEAPPP